MSSNAEPLMTVTEVAEYLGLKKKTVQNRVSLRQIPFVKVGRLVRFRRAEIDKWTKSHPVRTAGMV